MIRTKDEKISSLQAANEAQQELIAKLKALLDKSVGHHDMLENINNQEVVTSISIDQVTDQEKKQEESQH